MDNKKNKILTIIAFSILALMLIGGTYAFFAPQQGGTTSTNATVTSNTTDLLTFSINRDISFTVTQADFQENGTNQSGDATATATLTPNNKTGSATMNYYLYLNIESNPTVYSAANTNEDPELMLQVFDGNNQLVTLTGLGTQKTIKGVTGYDITGVSGLKTLLNNHAISASNNTATIENWRIVITLINLDVNQNDNTGKEVSAKIIIQKDEMHSGFTGTIYSNSAEDIYIGRNLLAINNENVYCEYNGIEDYNSCDLGVFWDTAADCESDLIEYNMEGYICQQETRNFSGLESYEENVNTIRTKLYNVYCPINDNNQTCTNSDFNFFEEEQDCEGFINRYLPSYTCNAFLITEPYYLKSRVENNRIKDLEVCLYDNNHEFCIGTDYWDTDGETTSTKLENAIESILGVDATCYSSANNAFCEVGDFVFEINDLGYIYLYLGNGYCKYEYGVGRCDWEMRI